MTEDVDGGIDTPEIMEGKQAVGIDDDDDGEHN